MLAAEVSKSKNILRLVYAGRVALAETELFVEEIRSKLAEVTTGFTLVSDLTDLETMDPACAAAIKKTMDVLNQQGIARVVRIIPDPRKDIGFNIMSLFHYRRGIRIVTCQTVEEAEAVLNG